MFSYGILAVIPFLLFGNAYGAVGDLCFENLPDGGATNDLCGLASGNITKVFLAPNQPLEEQIPGFALVILWGGIIGIVWFKTERIDVVGIVGLGVAATITGLSPTALGIGLFLLLVSLGILLFQVIRQRPTLFS